MPLQIVDSGTRRLLIAAAVSMALHGALLASVNRQPGGGNPDFSPQLDAAPLAARLTSVVNESELKTEVIPEQQTAAAEPIAQTAPAAVNPSPASATAGSADAAATPGTLYYFKSTELDRRPFPLQHVEVPPPESAGALAGSVMIRLRISESGRVEDAKIVMSTGIREFEEAALREFSGTQFHPGYRANLPVRSEMLIEVTLRPPQAGSARSSLAPASN